MTFTHALSTNNYGPAKFIVSSSSANGTHTTLASAMAVATSGDTIFLRDSVTENVTLTPGVNLCSWDINYENPTVTITGKLTMTGVGQCTISGINLKTNSDFCLAVTGSSASQVVLIHCAITANNNTAINFTSSSSSSSIIAYYCRGYIDTTGITCYTKTGPGGMSFFYSRMGNGGVSTTASTCSDGSVQYVQCTINFVSTSSATAGMVIRYTITDTSAINTTPYTIGGSGTNRLDICAFYTGSASALSIGGSATVNNCKIVSSNTNAITGAGTLTYGGLVLESSNVMNTTTQVALISKAGISLSDKQPAFSAYLPSTVTNITGNGTSFTLGSGTALTEIFDQNGDFVTSGTFTAPYTGKYQLNYFARNNGSVSITSMNLTIVTSNRSYLISDARTAVTTAYGMMICSLCDMDASDTATFTLNTNGAGADTDDIVGGANVNSGCSGWLVC